MTPLPYLLAALRWRPCKSPAGAIRSPPAGRGRPLLTCAAMEPPGAARQTRALIALPGPGVDYAMPPLPRPWRAQPSDCRRRGTSTLPPQSSSRSIPTWMPCSADAAADEDGVLLLFQAPSRAVPSSSASGCNELSPPTASRPVARQVPPGCRWKIPASPATATWWWNRAWYGANTSLTRSLPARDVTLPGRFMRGRQTARCRDVRLAELVADKPGGLRRIAVEPRVTVTAMSSCVAESGTAGRRSSSAASRSPRSSWRFSRRAPDSP